MGRSTFLFAPQGILRGMGRTFDLGATLAGHSYRYSNSPAEADALAAGEDWAAVGDDLRAAISRFREQHPELAAR